MTLSKKLRDKVCSKLDITPRSLLNRAKAKCQAEGVADPDIGLLLVAFDDANITVTKSGYSVPPDKIRAFEEHLKARKGRFPSQAPSIRVLKKDEKAKPRGPNLLNFKNRTPTYPIIFYNRLEDEINTAYGDERLPNAALMLSRKLIENLLLNLLQYKFGPKRLDLYFDTEDARAKDFSVLLKNLKDNKSAFYPDQHDLIDKFWDMAQKFRPEANATTHNLIKYLESIAQLRKFKIPEMTNILVELISQVRLAADHT
jgi:hypothetical protein